MDVAQERFIRRKTLIPYCFVDLSPVFVFFAFSIWVRNIEHYQGPKARVQRVVFEGRWAPTFFCRPVSASDFDIVVDRRGGAKFRIDVL